MTISAALALLATFHLPVSFAELNTTSVLYVKGDCKLIIENAHISKSLLKGQKPFIAVKANVASKCIYPQQKVIFQIWILKKVGSTWIKSKPFERDANPPLANPYLVNVKDAWIKCKNSTINTYLIQARSWATINGKEYASLVGISEKEIALPCGI
jgi:hypothetical protein